ncbi:conserved hypothetical protein [Vibrio nigripulchritudo MADA3029]|uniref:DUF2798 domain-containing protein n=1 Tax=Vibrio nigripulchritudo SOn1 TaxID=1238450 RepID=A0AAV2VS21_9VIBR|nr:DUF2798 domain-containing protein [Vibrio nigripulchritudo]CCN46512.1 conserved hypothetical protein [Vibrio nigripulchritudo MADA3020]CCN53914.1 conserved hypothetical protein [Vibrio nigripulchritudo MADA3021]CCN62456.1 conserved hypothetical protein [Vibrio nigripulchritudo MADA3029]CCN73573.1 conserved hypothetical protein [Vibrio nigripulchritudo SFn118]CCO47508.1 conserved hypothetical protein [Vibrio nigripulchritudo SOn1]
MKHRIIFGLLMSLVLSSMMTLWVTWLNLGFSDVFFSSWIKAFLLAWPAAAAISIALGPRVQKLTAQLVAFKLHGGHHA